MSRYCLKPHCPELVEGRHQQYCDEHAPAKVQWQGSSRKATLPKKWPVIRLRVLRRDKVLCQLGLVGCTGVATEVDHIGDRNDHSLANLRSVCSACHKQHTQLQAAAGRSAAAKRRSR